MIIHVANPIYDSVFKYLMEDEYYKAIEDRDTAIMQRDEMLKEQEKQLSQQSEQLRNMAKALFANGMTEEQISAMTGICLENVVELLK